jgi:hypothetical protein
VTKWEEEVKREEERGAGRRERKRRRDWYHDKGEIHHRSSDDFGSSANGIGPITGDCLTKTGAEISLESLSTKLAFSKGHWQRKAKRKWLQKNLGSIQKSDLPRQISDPAMMIVSLHST